MMFKKKNGKNPSLVLQPIYGVMAITLRTMRLERGLTQREVAERSKMRERRAPKTPPLASLESRNVR